MEPIENELRIITSGDIFDHPCLNPIAICSLDKIVFDPTSSFSKKANAFSYGLRKLKENFFDALRDRVGWVEFLQPFRTTFSVDRFRKPQPPRVVLVAARTIDDQPEPQQSSIVDEFTGSARQSASASTG
ncbi:MAG: hypothetical protein Q9211_001523 [Gyalolechia sp. 1 TL-2023]